jgi:membrane fusion protein (multidrug efflux system)
MKVKHCIVLVLTVSLASMAMTYWYMKTRSSAVKPHATMETRLAVPPLIRKALPTKRAFTLHVPWFGTVESKASVELTALIPGRVEVIEAEDQARIQEGKLVVRLGGPQVEEQHNKLRDEVKSLKSQVDLVRQKVKRLKQSLKSRLATKDQVAAAQNLQVKLETQLDEDRINLETFEKQIYISAPMSGTFTNRRVSAGQNVNAGQVIGEIIDADHLRITASIFPPQGIELQGKEATIRLSENQTLTGLIRRVLPQALNTGAVTVWIEGPRIDAQLRPGQMVEGNMVVKVRPDTLAVPESAIVYDSQEHPYLFVAKDSSYVPLSIQLGQVQNGWAEVLSGLEQDQFVVTQGAYELFYRQFNEQFKVKD